MTVFTGPGEIVIRKIQLVPALMFFFFSAFQASAAISISTTSLPAAKVSVGYRTALAATGGTAPLRWKIVSGALPAGIFFAESAGVIVGVPEQTANATLAITVTDASGASANTVLTLDVFAANWVTAYYVDNVTGSDSNSGTSPSTAWKTVARVNQASFAPGDQVLFKRGGIWREQLNISAAGMPGNPILFDAYGSGNPPAISGSDLLPVPVWTVCSTCQQYIWTTPVKTQPNIVLFNGVAGKPQISIANLDSATEWFWSNGILYVWFTGNPGYSYRSPGVELGSRSLGIGFFGASYITVQNLSIAGANGKPSNAAVYAQPSFQLGKSTHDISLHNLFVTNGAGDGIHLEDCQNCIVQGSSVSSMVRNGIALVSARANFPVTATAILNNTVASNGYDGIGTYGCAVGASCKGIVQPLGLFLSGVFVSHNTVHENGAGIYFRWTNYSVIQANSSYHNTNTALRGELEGIELEASSRNSIEKNLVYGNTMSGIELSNDRGAGTVITGSSGNAIAYNSVHDNGQHGLFTNAAPTANNAFRYNVVWNHVNGECFLANGTGHQFYGNTCWNNSTGIDLYTSGTTPTTANIAVRNNIIAGSIHQAVKIESGVSTSTLAFDHNDYYNPSTALRFLWPASSGDLTAWRSTFAYDLHSIDENPQFISGSPTVANELAVISSSPTAGAGQALNAISNTGLNAQSAWPGTVGFAQQTAAWDLGAFLTNP
jgi:parallel beta-helix repeat protein